MVKISIIIPVYNADKYLTKCLDSVVSQTLNDIEIICIDDGSTDNSLEILKKNQNKDKRITVIHFPESKSALQARKIGIEKASGEYIMFVDSDDYIEKDSCEILYNTITQEKVDILHFNSNIVNCGNSDKKRIQSNYEIIKPFYKKIVGNGKVFDACFIDNNFFITLWNKIFSTSLLKKCCGYIEDLYLPKAQDFYMFFIFAYFANSYKGINSPKLYNYCFGRGVTGNEIMDIDKFERYCSQANVVNALTTFCKKVGIYKKFELYLVNKKNNWLQECIKLWKNNLISEDINEGYKVLIKYWGLEPTISMLAKLYFYNRIDLIDKFVSLPKISLKEKNVKSVALYYYHMNIGGVQRVIAILSRLLLQIGYKVIVITDSPISDIDFELPIGCERCFIQNFKDTTGKNLKGRLDDWNYILSKFNIDVILYSSWTSNLLFWDMLFLKEKKCPVIVHCHSIFSYSLNKLDKSFVEQNKVISQADGIVVLSKFDFTYWSVFNNNVHYIQNPIDETLTKPLPIKHKNHSLIWVGRTTNEKQPWLIFTIMKNIVKIVPDAKLYLVGNFTDKKWITLAERNNISNNIEFCGEVTDVNRYYKKASVYVMTSLYEGYSMTLLEAHSYGLPTVMFNLSNLSLAQSDMGVVRVPMNDCTSFASEVVKLFTDNDHWQHQSNLSRKTFSELQNYDIEKEWHNLLLGKRDRMELSQDVYNMMELAITHYMNGIKYLETDKKNKENQTNNIKTQIEILKKSKTYRIGLIITYLPKKIKGGVKCLTQNGFNYTLKLFNKKIFNKFKITHS